MKKKLAEQEMLAQFKTKSIPTDILSLQGCEFWFYLENSEKKELFKQYLLDFVKDGSLNIINLDKVKTPTWVTYSVEYNMDYPDECYIETIDTFLTYMNELQSIASK